MGMDVWVLDVGGCVLNGGMGRWGWGDKAQLDAVEDT